MRRKSKSKQPTSSGTFRGGNSIPEDWPQRLDQPGDPNYLGVSVIFRQYAEPMFDGAATKEEIIIGCKIAMLAWNLASLPPHKRPPFLAPALQTMPIEIQAMFRQYLSMLIERKEQQFEQYQWFIGDFHVEENAGEIRLVVMASELDQCGTIDINR